METKKINLIIAGAFITALLFIKANCTKLPFDCAKIVYSFQLPVKAFPDKDTIEVGDTIWLEINEPTLIRDGISGEMINFSGTSNLGSAISFRYWDKLLSTWIEGAGRYEFILYKGNELKATSLSIEYRFIEEGGQYRFKVGIIPKEKGLQRLLFSSSNNTFRENDKCTKASFTINFKDTDQHYYLSPSYTGQTGLIGGDYYFYVK